MKLHHCKDCGKDFRDNRSFNAHECVEKYEELPLDELMKLYEAKRQGKLN